MAEENKAPQSEEKQEAKRDSVRHNWVTDIYDKMDISVRTLDIALVVLCAIVVFCFIVAIMMIQILTKRGDER